MARPTCRRRRGLAAAGYLLLTTYYLLLTTYYLRVGVGEVWLQLDGALEELERHVVLLGRVRVRVGVRVGSGVGVRDRDRVWVRARGNVVLLGGVRVNVEW